MNKNSSWYDLLILWETTPIKFYHTKKIILLIFIVVFGNFNSFILCELSHKFKRENKNLHHFYYYYCCLKLIREN